MQLKEQGKLDLEADIRTYLPEGFLTKLQYEDETITLLNLMSHNAGFQESMYENQLATEDQLFGTLEEAVKACECYQAYHVGEHTAYSNWGTALAALIVERVSGMDYVAYVHKNIFQPLGMDHTAIGMHTEDNPWVRQQREKLKCYTRYAQPEYNQDLGICRSWVQLYPAGAAVGTAADLARFAQGFVAEECPFFASNETREEMLAATSFYTGTDIAKTCHGLWTEQFQVPTLGHGGNAGGCTANLQFDPESGLGIVVMTNEPGETMFCTGLAGLLFGDVRNSRLVQENPIQTEADLNGIYVAARSIVYGFGRASRYAGGLLPVLRTDEPGVFNVPMTGGIRLVHIGENMWLQTSPSGDSYFIYQSATADGRRQLEMMSTDYVLSSGHLLGTAAYFGFVLLGLGCLMALAVKGIVWLCRKVRKKAKTATVIDRQIALQQAVQGVSGIILFCLISLVGITSRPFAVFSCLLAAALALLSLLNGILLVIHARQMNTSGKRSRVKPYLWAILCFACTAAILFFQLYDFVRI
jgi:CubicO group peptidase (beta-lactamase class C family)